MQVEKPVQEKAIFVCLLNMQKHGTFDFYVGLSHIWFTKITYCPLCKNANKFEGEVEEIPWPHPMPQ